ncbi:hypothetical protein [Streptomyces sp. NPDC000880]
MNAAAILPSRNEPATIAAVTATVDAASATRAPWARRSVRRLRARPPPATAEAVALISELYAERWAAPKNGGAARSR